MIARLFVFPILVLAYGACTAPVGSNLQVPSNATSTCEAHCRSIGLELSAVAIMASHVGCVCQRATSPQAASDHGESVTAGMATIMLQEEQQAAQRRQQAQANQNKK